MCKFILLLLFVLVTMDPLFGQSTNSAIQTASAINALGLDLLHLTGPADQNALLSPYSIETALMMTCAGADGKTREEMSRVLHLRGNDAQVVGAFVAIQAQLDEAVQKSVQAAERTKKYGGTNEPIVLNIANRLFGEKDYDFRTAFLDLLKTKFNAPFQAMDFRKASAGAAKTINDWVAQKTGDRIRDLIPPGALNALTRLVLVNAVYLKAPWENEFPERATASLPFHARGGDAVNVPTMTTQKAFGYAKGKGLTVVSVPYKGGDFQFLIILPDEVNGLAAVEAALTAGKLAGFANLRNQNVRLFLPKFKIEPPALLLSEALQKLGMTTAFDNPRGSANFDRMAPRRPPDDYLYISKVIHKTFMSVDEKGTEAAAASAVVLWGLSAQPRPVESVEVKVDHPFVFAIQDRATGACLFLGHVVDPR